MEKSFRQFAELATDAILANGDDPHVVETLDGLSYISFGLSDKNRIYAKNVSSDGRHFDVICDGSLYCHLDLLVFGRHNVLNALAAAGSAWYLGIPGEAVTSGLATFTGADRRMQYKGQVNGAALYDDYAHHPDELAATIAAVRMMGHRRLVLAFQPHTYTRTKALFDEFITELSKADVLLIAEIYAARERNTVGISSKDLTNRIPGSIYCETLQDVAGQLAAITQPGDIVLTVGAGDIFRAGEMLLEQKR